MVLASIVATPSPEGSGVSDIFADATPGLSVIR